METVAASEEEAHEEHHDHGLSDVGYIKIALILGVLTAVEAVSYTHLTLPTNREV